MSVPGFQEILLPLLKLAQDGRDHRTSDVIAVLADEFGLSDAERLERLQSGKQSRFANRVGWARTYLSKAGLIESSGYGSFRITERGKSVLADGVASINMAYLERFPEFLEFRAGTPKSGGQDEPKSASEEAPEEIIQTAHAQLMRALEEDLLEQVKRRSPAFFETLVIDLLVRMGYGGSRAEAGERIGRSGDGGIDGIIKEDKLGLDIVYVQAKRWEGTVQRPTVQEFAGSLLGKRARKGVLITTSKFSEGARQYVEQLEQKVILIDGQQLVRYMIEHGVGVAEVANYSIKRVALDELDYYEEAGVVTVVPVPMVGTVAE